MYMLPAEIVSTEIQLELKVFKVARGEKMFAEVIPTLTFTVPADKLVITEFWELKLVLTMLAIVPLVITELVIVELVMLAFVKTVLEPVKFKATALVAYKLPDDI